MSKLARLRAWWHRWREEFYEDNPISWLAAAPFQAFHRALSKKQLHQLAQEIVQEHGEAEGAKLTAEALTRLREQFPKPPISQLSPVWSVSKNEQVQLAILWSIPLIMVVVALSQDWHAALRHSISPAHIILIVFPYSVAIVLLAFSSALLWVPLQQTLLPEGALYIGLTKLESRHLVYGILSHTIARGLRRIAFYGLPWLLLFGVMIYGTLGAALWFAVIAALYLAAAGWFYNGIQLTLIGRSIAKSNESKSFDISINYISFISLLKIVIFAVILASIHKGTSSIVLPPVWAWITEPLWWMSLIPPLFLGFAPLVSFHPFWGIPQILVLLGLNWFFTRKAIAYLSVVPRLREQSNARSSDEDWE